MGGGKSDSSQTNETVSTNSTDTLNSSVQDNQGIALSSLQNSTVDLNITDGGAIEKMFMVTQSALNQSEKASRSAMDYTFKASNPNTTTESKNTYIMGAVLFAAVAVVYMGKK